MLRALSTSLAAILLFTLAPSAAIASDELPRRRPRLTDPGDSEEYVAPARTKKDRSHARPIDDDQSAEGEGEEHEQPAPTPKPAPAAVADDEELPAVDRGESWEEQPRRSRARHDEDEDWSDNSRPRRSGRTVEEDLREEQERPRRLANRDEPGYGLATELLLGAAFVQDAVEGSDATFAFGLSFAWQLGRMFAPENRLLHKGLFLEAGWLHPLGSTEGTEWLKVNASQHDLWLAVLFGYPFHNVHVYGKFGPAMSIMPVAYDVQGTMTEWSGVKGGVVYGAGARTTLYLNRDFGIAGRLEVTRFRRGYLDDTVLSGGVGVTF